LGDKGAQGKSVDNKGGKEFFLPPLGKKKTDFPLRGKPPEKHFARRCPQCTNVHISVAYPIYCIVYRGIPGGNTPAIIEKLYYGPIRYGNQNGTIWCINKRIKGMVWSSFHK